MYDYFFISNVAYVSHYGYMIVNVNTFGIMYYIFVFLIPVSSTTQQKKRGVGRHLAWARDEDRGGRRTE